jgi:hypothetical protein
MLNVKTLTDTMSRMELPQLQQYAALHKNDPYIVTLALSIANQKKQMKMGQEGQAGMQPQSKVVDRDIFGIALEPEPRGAVPPQQQAMPEDQGIGTLPAQNMQNFASGGIVAFGGGGDVPGYYEGALVGQGFRRDQMLPPPTSNRNALIAGTLSNISAQSNQDELKRIEAQLQAMPPSPQRDYLENRKRILLGSPAVSAAPTVPAPAPAPAVNSYDPATATRRSMFVDQAAPPPPPTDVAAAKPPTTAKPPAAPVASMAGITALNTKPTTAAEAKAEAARLSDSSKLQTALQNNEAFTSQAYDKLLGDYDKKIAEMPEAYKGYEARLKKEETEAATDKDKALGMSIFQAGLGMMAGTSQYAFENISKGALSGLDNYQSALKDLKKAQRERDKAFADIEAARLAEKRGDIRAQTELQAKGIEALGNAKNRTVDGIGKIFQVDTETAKGIFDTKFKEVAQNERTIYTTKAELAKQAQADAAALERTKIQTEATTAATGMRGDTSHRETWAKSPYLQTQYPNINDYLRAMGVQPTVNLPKDAPVLP